MGKQFKSHVEEEVICLPRQKYYLVHVKLVCSGIHMCAKNHNLSLLIRGISAPPQKKERNAPHSLIPPLPVGVLDTEEFRIEARLLRLRCSISDEAQIVSLSFAQGCN